MKVFGKLGDRLLDRLVPQEDAGACSEYITCVWPQKKRCYVGCGRPTFCVTIGRCLD
jgi:hypothetical protein